MYQPENRTYRGRIAPSPTGYLHLGHARTFWIAQQRAQAKRGAIVLRNDDLDTSRCKREFVHGMIEDLKWFGFQWQEGPEVGGPFAPYHQSERLEFYRAALATLQAGNFIYPCTCSRKDIQAAVNAPHAADDEPIYPGTCRSKNSQGTVPGLGTESLSESDTLHHAPAPAFHWRFRVPDGEVISFMDGNFGWQQFIAGRDFGDFVVWRNDDVPAYQLACVVDDAAMEISEVVRGADLLVSTARQLLLYRALNLAPPDFFHCTLLTDETGQRLAKRHAALSLRTLRAHGATPEELRAGWNNPA